MRIRARWVSTPTRRQDSGLGPAFDGSQGVDSQDILGIPQIGFSTFQLFPDQNEYAPDDPNLPAFNNSIESGLEWILKQAQSAQLYGKPSLLTGFGLVTQGNAPDFVPFNSTMVANTTSISSSAPNNPTAMTGISDDQRDSGYQQWLQGGITDGINGMMQYQWGQGNLTSQTGTAISSPNSTGTNPAPPSSNPTGPSPNESETGVSPDDGYSTTGTGQDGVQSVLKTASQNIAAD